MPMVWPFDCNHQCPKCGILVTCSGETCTGHKQLYCDGCSLRRGNNVSYKPYGASPQTFQSQQQYQQQLQNAAAGNSNLAGSLGGMTIANNTLGLNQYSTLSGTAQLVTNPFNTTATSTVIPLTTTAGTVNPTTGWTYTYVPANGSFVTPPGQMPVPQAPEDKENAMLDMAKLAALEKVEPRKLADRVPDSIVPITAWRAWSVKLNDEGKPRLYPLADHTEWVPKKPLEARCCTMLSASFSMVQGHKSKAPHIKCSCGVWGFKTREQLIGAIVDSYNIAAIGTVAMWGKVIETSLGFRAEYAYPTELWLFKSDHEELSRIYNVPIRSL